MRKTFFGRIGNPTVLPVHEDQFGIATKYVSERGTEVYVWRDPSSGEIRFKTNGANAHELFSAVKHFEKSATE